MKFIVLVAIVFSSSVFATNYKMKIGTGYERRAKDSVRTSPPYLTEMEIECSPMIMLVKKMQSQISTMTVTTDIFTFETKKSCLVMVLNSINGGESELFGQLNIPYSGTVNELQFYGTPTVLEDGYTYVPTLGISPI